MKGLLVAEEPNFLSSYNLTQLNASLRRALNREPTNVGRGAYSERVKDVLKECRSSAVAEPLTADLGCSRLGTCTTSWHGRTSVSTLAGSSRAKKRSSSLLRGNYS